MRDRGINGLPVLPPITTTQNTPKVQTTPEIEKKYVHNVYDAIAPHFSSTRYARWPKVQAFLNSLLIRAVKTGGLVLITVWAREQEDSSLVNKWTPLSQKYLEEWIGPGSPRVRSPSALLSFQSIPESEESVSGERLNSRGKTGSSCQQEYFVPWHLPYHRAEVGGASADAVANGLARKDNNKG